MGEGGPKSWSKSRNKSRPHAVLFACGLNSVRSPMAAALL